MKNKKASMPSGITKHRFWKFMFGFWKSMTWILDYQDYLLSNPLLHLSLLK